MSTNYGGWKMVYRSGTAEKRVSVLPADNLSYFTLNVTGLEAAGTADKTTGTGRICGLRHELSSLARTLGSWVRIPLKACMSLCAFILFVLSCVQTTPLRRADHSSKEYYRLCKSDYETEEEARAQQRAVEPLVNEK
jgi:hypothetical protein